MRKGTYIEVKDLITGYCPACRHSRIELQCNSICGNDVDMTYKCVITCEHLAVCKLRHDYMEEGK